MHYVTMGTKQHDVIIMSTHTFVVNTKVHMYKEWKTYVQGMENICRGMENICMRDGNICTRDGEHISNKCGAYMKLTNKGKERTHLNANCKISKYHNHSCVHGCFH